jgi:hypothetical protein
MTNKQVQAQKPLKKPYAKPQFVRHGDMRTLTRSGTGSVQEPTNQGQGSPQKRP